MCSSDLMGDTKFAETNINDMLHAGASINDISQASRVVNAGQLTAATAEKLLMKDFTANDIIGLGNRGEATDAKIAGSKGGKISKRIKGE